MNSAIKPISIKVYNALFLQTQEEHSFRNEPIPEMSDESLKKIEYILQVPFQRIFGKILYWGFYKKASVLFYLMIKNHPLSNGNKRMACSTLILFYKINDKDFNLSEKELYELAYLTVNSNSDNYDYEINKITTYLKSH